MNAPIALRSHLSVVGYLVVSLAVLGSALLAQAQGLAALQDLIHPGLGSPVYSVSQLWAELGRTPQE